jgi:hypothetical protein
MARLIALGFLAAGGSCVLLSILLILRGDYRGLLTSAVSLLVIWCSILMDRDIGRRRRSLEDRGFYVRSPDVPPFITRVVGLAVLALGGFLLVACLAQFFSGEPGNWLGLANSPISIVIVWMGLLVDRDRLREERRRQRILEGDPHPERPENKGT